MLLLLYLPVENPRSGNCTFKFGLSSVDASGIIKLEKLSLVKSVNFRDSSLGMKAFPGVPLTVPLRFYDI